mgnify:CR=1 FL=1
MTNKTYFVFRKYTDNTYYTLNDNLNPIKEKIELSDDNVKNGKKPKYLKFNKDNNNAPIDIINNFLFNKEYIKQSYSNNNITYIIYKDSESLLTIRKLDKDTNTLYIIEFENNEESLSNLFKLLEKNLKSSDITSIYQQFGIESVLNT